MESISDNFLSASVSLDLWIEQNDVNDLYLPRTICYEEITNHMSTNESNDQVAIEPFCGINYTTSKSATNYDSKSNIWLLNSAGPVWAIDWYDCSNDEQNDFFYLAVGAHPPLQNTDDEMKLDDEHWTSLHYNYHIPGTSQPGTNLIQLWQIPKDDSSSDSTLKMTAGISHCGGAVWDLKWASTETIDVVSNATKQIQSSSGCILAAALAIGVLNVYWVPNIDKDLTTKTIIMPLVPLFQASLKDALIWTISWSPFFPSQLLTGNTDGSVALWDLKSTLDKENETAELVCIARFVNIIRVGIKSNPSWAVIRAVAWCPYDRNVFACGGNDDVLSFWDLRDPRAPFYSIKLNGLCWIIALKWHSEDHSLYLTTNNGTLHCMHLEPSRLQKLIISERPHETLWDVCIASNDQNSKVFYCNSEGCLRFADLHNQRDKLVFNIASCLVDPNQENPNIKCNLDCTIVEKEKSFLNNSTVAPPRNLQALHRLACKKDEELPIFATGGAAGIVYCGSVEIVMKSKKKGRPVIKSKDIKKITKKKKNRLKQCVQEESDNEMMEENIQRISSERKTSLRSSARLRKLQ